MGRRGAEEDDSHSVHFEYIAALRVSPHRERHYGRGARGRFPSERGQDQLDRLKKDMMETFDLSGTTIGLESNDEHEV